MGFKKGSIGKSLYVLKNRLRSGDSDLFRFIKIFRRRSYILPLVLIDQILACQKFVMFHGNIKSQKIARDSRDSRDQLFRVSKLSPTPNSPPGCRGYFNEKGSFVKNFPVTVPVHVLIISIIKLSLFTGTRKKPIWH